MHFTRSEWLEIYSEGLLTQTDYFFQSVFHLTVSNLMYLNVFEVHSLSPSTCGSTVVVIKLNLR